MQWCLGRSGHDVLSYAWQKRREGDGVQRLADLANLPASCLQEPSVLDGTKPFYVKKHGRIVQKVEKRIGLPKKCPSNGNCEHPECSAVRQFFSAKNFAERGWHHGGTDLEANWYPRERSILGISGTWLATRKQREPHGSGSGCIARTSS